MTETKDLIQYRATNSLSVVLIHNDRRMPDSPMVKIFEGNKPGIVTRAAELYRDSLANAIATAEPNMTLKQALEDFELHPVRPTLVLEETVTLQT
jgi:hypothetical protein